MLLGLILMCDQVEMLGWKLESSLGFQKKRKSGWKVRA